MELSEDEIRYMKEEVVNRDLDVIMPAIRAEVTKALQEMSDDQDPMNALATLDWADAVEYDVVDLAEATAPEADDFRYGAAVFATRPGEEALAETLRGHAAWLDVKRAEAEEIAAAARRLRHVCLRTLAAGDAADLDLVLMAAMEYLDYLCKDKVHRGESMRMPLFAEAATAEEVDAAARAPGSLAAARFAEEFVKRAERLRRGATEFGGEDQALADALRERAAAVEALCVDVEAFVGKMVSSGYWRMWTILNRQLAGSSTTAATPAK